MTSLSLHNDWMFDEYDGLPTMTELRGIFARLTSLERLSLKDVYPKEEPNPPEPFTFYPALESLTFHFSLNGGMYESHYAAFWTLFNAPATTSLKIWAYAEVDDFDADVEGLMDPVTRIDSTKCPVKELVIDDLSMTMWCTDAESPSAMLTLPFRRLDVEHPTSVITRTVVSSNSAVKFNLPHLRLGSIRSISVTDGAQERLNRPEPAGGWIAKLGTARDVRRISVYYTLYQPLLDDLLKKDSSGQQLLFPLLDTIVLHHDWIARETPQQTSLGLILSEVLEDRYKHGAPIRDVYVDKGMERWFIWSKVDREKT